MSFLKAEQLIQLATLVSSRRYGVTLEEVSDQFEISHRTAQRMMRTLENQFADVETFNGDDNRKRWRMAGLHLRDLLSLSADELASIELGITHLKRAGLGPEAQTLTVLKDKVLSLIPRSKSRLEPDYDALLEAQGFIARPGPKPKINQNVHAKIVEAIKSCQKIKIKYKSVIDPSEKPRLISPYGFLSGIRRYLVAEDQNSSRGPTLKTYRLDSISDVVILDDYFIRPEDFNLQEYANRAFGVFQRDNEYTDIIWKFTPEAAEQAKSYQFHPEQSEELLDDGSLIIKFKSSGYLEMSWYLYSWGNKVEVLAPQKLKDMVRHHQRNDFPAMP
jgi:predicted DNA-binding transcriptional regulator YafY